MNKLTLLIRYKLKMWSNIPLRRGRRKIPLPFYILMLAGVFIAISVPLYLFTLELFQNYSKIIFNGISLADLFVEISMIGIFVLVLVTDTPAIALNVFMSEDVDFLLSLPISQSTIFISKNLETIIQGGFPALFVIPILISYANATMMPWYMITVMFLMYIIYFVIVNSISSIIALGVSKFASRSGTQRFMVFTSLIVYVLSILLMSTVSSLNPNDKNVTEAFASYLSTINLPFLPSTWFINAIKLRIDGLLPLIITATILAFVTYRISSSGILSGYSKMKSATKHIRMRNYNLKSPEQAFVSKDLKLMRREPSILFLLIYPAIFPLFLLIGGVMGRGQSSITHALTGGILISIFISSMYTVIATASLVSIEIKVGEFIKTLPVGNRTPLWSKAFVITGAFAIVMIVTFSILSAFFGGFILSVITVLLSIPVLLILSFFGVYATVKWPNSIGGVRRPLNTTGNFVSMGIGFLGALIATSEGLYFSGNRIFPFLSPAYQFLIFLAGPIAGEIIMAFVIFKLLSKIDWANPYETK